MPPNLELTVASLNLKFRRHCQTVPEPPQTSITKV